MQCTAITLISLLVFYNCSNDLSYNFSPLDVDRILFEGTTCSVFVTCSRSLHQGKLPSSPYEKKILNSGNIPNCLLHSPKLEKRLIAKINIFITVVMLPGDQYTEGGLVLNLPSFCLGSTE
ncbi:hypothetical protein ACF0H5_003531 [Mactra antiquata]